MFANVLFIPVYILATRFFVGGGGGLVSGYQHVFLLYFS